ncbi:MAG: iron-sulfur cluster assembly accessory protein [Pseudomonadota bacterium]
MTLDLTTPVAVPQASAGPLAVTDRAFRQLAAVAGETGTQGVVLRVAVLGGGCSGFQYEFALVDAPAEDDTVIPGPGALAPQKVVVDPESVPFLEGSVLDFKDELIGARFAIENPNASSTCGCGTSFSI